MYIRHETSIGWGLRCGKGSIGLGRGTNEVTSASGGRFVREDGFLHFILSLQIQLQGRYAIGTSWDFAPGSYLMVREARATATTVAMNIGSIVYGPWLRSL